MMMMWLGVLFGDITYGPAKAPIVLVVYFDVNCEACREWHKDIWPDLKKRWCGTNGPLRVIFKPYPVAAETLTFMACCQKLTSLQQTLLFEVLMDDKRPTHATLEGGMQGLKKPYVLCDSATLKEALRLTNHYHFEALPVMFVNGRRLSDYAQDNLQHYLEGILP